MKKTLGIGIAGIIVLYILSSLFVIGAPIDGNQLAYNISQNNSILELRVSAKEPAVALRGWEIKQEGKDLFISAKKVLVSFLFSSGEYQTSIDIDNIENIYLGGQMIWNNKSASNKISYTNGS